MSKEEHPIPEPVSLPRVFAASAAMAEAWAAYLEHVHAPDADFARRWAQDPPVRSPGPSWVIDRTGAKLARQAVGMFQEQAQHVQRDDPGYEHAQAVLEACDEVLKALAEEEEKLGRDEGASKGMVRRMIDKLTRKEKQ